VKSLLDLFLFHCPFSPPSDRRSEAVISWRTGKPRHGPSPCLTSAGNPCAMAHTVSDYPSSLLRWPAAANETASALEAKVWDTCDC